MRNIFCVTLFLTAGSFAATNDEARLADAVKNRDAAQVAVLLAQKANPNIAEPDGTTALAWAVRQNDTPLVEKLLRAGANPKTANRYGVTPLYLACLNGNAQMVERLLKAGADVNTASSEGETPLMTVARSGNVEAAKVLLAHKADVYARETWHRQTALMYSTAEAHPDMMRLLIEHGALVNDQDGVQKWERQVTKEPRDKWLPTGAMTPLLFASRQGCVECARVLIEHGAEPNATDRDDVTPMISAIINGHYDVAAYLVEHGANPNLADITGRTPLYSAVDCHTMPQDNRPSPKDLDNKVSSFELIELLIAKGADVNAQLKKQVPYRAKLDRGDDTMLTTGTTPLVRAAKAGDVPVIELLLAKGADAKLVTRNGVNALMAAAGVGTKEEDNTGRKKTEPDTITTIRLLMAAGLDVNAVDSRGQSALHGAAFWGKDQVVEYLVKNGAKLSLKDKKGFTALDSAMGVAGGVGFDGASATPRPSTAELLKKLASGSSD